MKLIQQRNGLFQFEGCMALTNLASLSEDLRCVHMLWRPRLELCADSESCARTA